MTKTVETDQPSMNLWVRSRSVDFRLGLSLQGFYVLYFILSEFLTKKILEGIVNPAYSIGCCDCTFINLVLRGIVLIFNAIHKMGCYKYWYCLRWYNLWHMKSKAMEVSYNPPFFLFKEICTYSNFCFIICFLFFLILCFLNFAFDIYIMWFLCSNKTWLSQRFFLLSRYELVLLEHFLFCFHVFIFLSNYQF